MENSDTFGDGDSDISLTTDSSANVPCASICINKLQEEIQNAESLLQKLQSSHTSFNSELEKWKIEYKEYNKGDGNEAFIKAKLQLEVKGKENEILSREADSIRAEMINLQKKNSDFKEQYEKEMDKHVHELSKACNDHLSVLKLLSKENMEKDIELLTSKTHILNEKEIETDKAAAEVEAEISNVSSETQTEQEACIPYEQRYLILNMLEEEKVAALREYENQMKRKGSS